MTLTLQSGDLQIAPSASPREGELAFAWRGKSAARSPGEILAPFFKDALDAAQAAGASLRMSFNELSHFNSSTITALLSLIEEAKKRSVKLVFVYDGNTKWQRMSFGAMRVLAKGDGLFTLETI